MAAPAMSSGSPMRPSGQEATIASRKRSSVDRKSTRLNSSHLVISYAVFCLKKKRPDRKSTRLNSSHLVTSYAGFSLKISSPEMQGGTMYCCAPPDPAHAGCGLQLGCAVREA